ncbi:uncharacterized protein LOC125203554 isoform X2 [Salvia hispanica]|uniref:uncharacterized protein LOC125203554 isoform X2 n=1 Tax=Salvia hispanica TaxID=49212 RepID=UPI002009A7DB|nr:uncharacterized protein LOC125203554 isoform X2 [Salvia hispanica]
MATPNMATIERSLQNCSLNHQLAVPAAETLELNSEATALPLHWEQCLDLKSGEIYYINWKTGMKATEDPRTVDFSEEDSSDGSSSPSSSTEHNTNTNTNTNNVVVVAGCKACLMYYMLPKHLQICPKCCAQLLHLDPSQNAPSS